MKHLGLVSSNVTFFGFALMDGACRCPRQHLARGQSCRAVMCMV